MTWWYPCFCSFLVFPTLSIHHNATDELYKLDKYFKMKDGSIGDPDMYLGAKLRKFTLANGVQAWGFSPSKYVNDAIRNMEKYLQDEMNGLKLLKNCLLYTSPSPRDGATSRMPSSA